MVCSLICCGMIFPLRKIMGSTRRRELRTDLDDWSDAARLITFGTCCDDKGYKVFADRPGYIASQEYKGCSKRDMVEQTWNNFICFVWYCIQLKELSWRFLNWIRLYHLRINVTHYCTRADGPGLTNIDKRQTPCKTRIDRQTPRTTRERVTQLDCAIKRQYLGVLDWNEEITRKRLTQLLVCATKRQDLGVWTGTKG